MTRTRTSVPAAMKAAKAAPFTARSMTYVIEDDDGALAAKPSVAAAKIPRGRGYRSSVQSQCSQ